MEYLIKSLQELKQHQLAVLQRPVVIDAVSLKKREDELLNNLKDVMKQLSSFGSQKLRLLYVLAHENYELFITFFNENQSKLREKIHRRYILFGDNFLVHHIPAHQTLVSWFTEVKQLAEKESESCSSIQRFPNFSDKHAFNIKYDPLCSKCKEMIGLTITNLKIYQEIQNSTASLSFSTRRQGFCCRIILQAACRLCQILSEGISDVMGTNDDDIEVISDPCFFDGALKLRDEQLETAQAFVTGKIWPAIDEKVTTVIQR